MGLQTVSIEERPLQPRPIVRWATKLGLLSVELIGYRFRRSRVAAVLAIGEPIGVIFFFSLLHSMTDISRAPFGDSVVLFYTTGIIPFYLFLHASLRFRTWDYLPRYPEINELDLGLAQIISELISKLIILVACYCVMALFGIDAVAPTNPWLCFEALLALVFLGAGTGLFNAVIAGFFFPWTYIYQVIIRGVMAFSGILVVADYIPEPLRTWSKLLPMTHAITLYRAGQYVGYPTFTLDMPFLVSTTVGSVVLGCLAESGTRRWRTFR